LAPLFVFSVVCAAFPAGSRFGAEAHIEHRLFAVISRNWRGKPLISHQVILPLTGATTTQTGVYGGEKVGHWSGGVMSLRAE